MRLSPRVLPLVLIALLGAALPATAAVAKSGTNVKRSSKTTAATVVPPAPYPAFAESFTSPTWFTSWGKGSQPFRSSVETETSGNRFLRVHIPKGEHDGTSFSKSTGTLDAVTMRYRLRFSNGWDPSQSKHNVKLPGFGSPRFDAGGGCLAGCGGAAGDGVTGYSARSDVQDTGVPGSYLYDVSSATPYPYGRGIRWNAEPFQPGRWYDVDLRIAMNTPGKADGVLRASIDGVTVMHRTDVKFRHLSALHVGTVWFDFYYGGSGVAPSYLTIDVDDIALYPGI